MEDEWITLFSWPPTNVLLAIYGVGAAMSFWEAFTDGWYARKTATFAVFQLENAVWQWLPGVYRGDPVSASIASALMTYLAVIGYFYYKDIQEKWERYREEQGE